MKLQEQKHTFSKHTKAISVLGCRFALYMGEWPEV